MRYISILIIIFLGFSVLLNSIAACFAEENDANTAKVSKLDNKPSVFVKDSSVDKSAVKKAAENKAGDDNPETEKKTLKQMMFEMVLGLGFVITLIITMSVLYKRSLLFNQAQQSALKVVSVLAVGPKQKVVLVKAVSHYLLLGVTDQTVTLLKEFSDTDELDFSEWLNTKNNSAKRADSAQASFENVIAKLWTKKT